jgi:ribosomal protein L7/L12
VGFLKKLKARWVNLNLLFQILIISGVFIVLLVININIYVSLVFLTIVSLLGTYDGVKHKKKIQMAISIVFLLGSISSISNDISIHLSNKTTEAEDDAKENKVRSVDKKTKKKNNMNLDEENKNEVAITESASIPVEQSMDTKIWNSIGSNESSNVLNVTYSDLGDDKVVVIKMALRENFTATDMLKSGFIDAKNIIKSVDSNYRSEITKYDFWFVGNVTDSSGSSDIQKLLSFEYNRNKLNSIDLSAVVLDDFIRQGENMWVHPVFNI